MSVWYCIPTADPVKAGKSFARWQAMGYKCAALTDGPASAPSIAQYDIHFHNQNYLGWPHATNWLGDRVLSLFRDVQWIVAGGDDMDPDPNKRADEIAAECAAHFAELGLSPTDGVMQPTGDRWGLDASGRVAAERICGSPWLGRAFCESRAGKPFDESFFHFFADEKLHDELIGTPRLWQRPDLTHFHHHWHRTGAERPAHMSRAAELWGKDLATFQAWKDQEVDGVAV